MTNKYLYAIGVDPDVDRSGIAVYEILRNKLIVVDSLSLCDLFDSIINLKNTLDIDEFIVRLEAGWLQKKSNWHASMNQYTAQRIASNVGANHEIGRQIEKMLIRHNINYELLNPSGYSSFFKDAELFKRTTGWNEKTNNDSRSACAMVWGYKN